MKILPFLKKHWLCISIILLFIIKYIIVDCQILCIKGYKHDDLYFLKAAYQMVHGKWLGSYNDITLSKGISGILLIALSYKIGISYLHMLGFLYFLACVSVIKVLKHIISNPWILLIIYILLLFNPISYSDSFSFVYRDGLYTILILFLFTFSFEIFFYYQKSMKNYFIYIVLYSITFTFTLLCREETLCIIPYIIFSLGTILLFVVFNRNCSDKVMKIILLLFVPGLIYFGTIHIISYQNLIHYNRYVVNDFSSKDFKDLYGAVTRIKQVNYIKRVPLNKESRELLYEKSPLFKELEPYLESEDYYKSYTYSTNKEYQEGFLYWAIRSAGNEIGYYDNAHDAYRFHTLLADEINNLCDTKEIDCTKKRSSLIAPIHKEIIPDFFHYLSLTFSKQITYENVIVEIPEVERDNSLYLEVTKNKGQYNNGKLIRLDLMKVLLELYKLINPIIFVISLLLFLYMIPYFVKTWKTNYPYLFILLGLLYLYLSRIAVVSFVATAEYEQALSKSQYLASAFPIQMILSILIICFYHQFKIKKSS